MCIYNTFIISFKYVGYVIDVHGYVMITETDIAYVVFKISVGQSCPNSIKIWQHTLKSTRNENFLMHVIDLIVNNSSMHVTSPYILNFQ